MKKEINEVADIINEYLDEINEDTTSIAVTSCARKIVAFLDRPAKETQ